MSMSLLIAGGGTGGHLFPGVAVARALLEMAPGAAVAFVSAGKALESRVLAESGLPLEALPVRALRGRGLMQRLAALMVLPGALWAARGIIRRRRPGLVLAVGGYAAFPLGLAAWLSGVPLAVQEQNALPGLTNRVLSRLAREVYISFQAAAQHLPAGKSRLTGNPVRLELIDQAQASAGQRPPSDQVLQVLVLGGSQGAHHLNLALMEALPLLADVRARLALVHQTGPADQEAVAQAYAEQGFKARVEAFFTDMGPLYGQAHLVICRSGAGTLTELAATGRASVCVPYPFAAGDHQTLNAQCFVQAGAALLVPDAQMDGPRAAAIIRQFLEQPQELARLERQAAGLARPQAAREIAGRCLELMREAA